MEEQNKEDRCARDNPFYQLTHSIKLKPENVIYRKMTNARNTQRKHCLEINRR